LRTSEYNGKQYEVIFHRKLYYQVQTFVMLSVPEFLAVLVLYPSLVASPVCPPKKEKKKSLGGVEGERGYSNCQV